MIYDDSIELKAAYPEQTDPQYWSKVPLLFEKEFANKEKLKTFKSNWFVLQVPLYIPGHDPVAHGYITSTLKTIIENYDDSQHAGLINLMTESKVGHTPETYKRFTVNFRAEYDFNDKHYCYDVQNIGFLRSIRAHNVLTYELATGKYIKDYDVIVEIGGGIGEFAKISRNVGFNGRYYCIDFTPMCEINMYNNGYDVRNNYVNFASQLPVFAPETKILFVGTWSFSELPISYRDEIVSILPQSCDWLLTAQSDVFGINNDRYFDKQFAPRLTKRIQKIDIPHHPYQGGNYYYFAT